MSFAYKTLNPSDITISPYTANKLYTFASSSLTEYGIVVYSGEYEPIINVSCSDGPAEGQVPCNPYNPENDITSNGYARRLIYDSIQKLYYQSFISGGFSNVLWTSSSYENYLQTALTSGSNYLTNIRVFGQDSGSGGSVYDGGIYDTGSYPSDPSLIRVISIPQDIFGSGIKPGTFEISSSNYLIQDDGQGNLMDNKAITSSLYEGSPYTSNVYGGNTNRQGIHVGNIIYSHGMVIVTNEDYFCFYPSEPVAQNNSYVLLNVQPTKSLAVLSNDFDNCNELDTGSLSIVTPLPGYSFPDNSSTNGAIRINPTAVNNLQVTPGLYKGTYFVSNSAGVPSNYATVSLELYASPLQFNVVSYTTGCYAASTTQSITFALNYGIPPYSWSFNPSSSWNNIGNLYQPTQSVTASVVSSSRSVTLYAKDSVGAMASQSLTLMSSNINVVYTTASISCNGGTGSITVLTASSDLPVSVSINNGSTWITSYPYTFTTSSGQHFLDAKNTSGCYIYPNAISIPLDEPQRITASLSVLQGDCTDPSVGNVGALSVNITLNTGVPPYSYTWYFNGSPLVPNQNTNLPTGLQTGSYYVIVSDAAGGCNDGTSNTVNVTGTNSITFTTSSTAVGCYGTSTGQINLIFAGGLGSVTGSIYSGSILITSSAVASTGSANITATGLSSGSNYSIRLIDTRGCTISQSVTVGSPANPFEVDLNATGALYIYKPGLYDPYTAQFKLHGGNSSSYHVTLSVISPGGSSYVDVASGSFSGGAGTSSLSMPISGACLFGATTWSLTATDALGCSLSNANIQTEYILPTQVESSLVQYLPTGSTAPGNNPQNVCTASFVNLYFTSSETSTGWSGITFGDHVWENCDLTISASGYAVTSSAGLIAPISGGIYTGSFITPSCAPASPPNRFYCWILNSVFFGTSQIDGFFTSTYYNIVTNGVVTQSYASLSGYGDSGISSNYIQWSGSNTSFNVYDSPVSTMLATATTNFSMPFGIGVSLYSATKGTSPTDFFTIPSPWSPVVSGYFLPPGTFCYDDNYQYNYSGVNYQGNQLFPQNVPFDSGLDYILIPSFQTHDNPTICTFQ
jgi:hypothetical protein